MLSCYFKGGTVQQEMSYSFVRPFRDRSLFKCQVGGGGGGGGGGGAAEISIHHPDFGDPPPNKI